MRANGGLSCDLLFRNQFALRKTDHLKLQWTEETFNNNHAIPDLACVAGGIVGAREIKFWPQSRQKRAAKPREIPPARELGYFEYRPLLSPH